MTTKLNLDFVLTSQQVNEKIANFKIGPLKRGMGDTLGNSIRRTVYNSTIGAAIESFSCTEVAHKFQSVSFAREDALKISINLKKVIIYPESVASDNETYTVTISKKEEILAKELEVNGLKIYNRDMVIMYKSSAEPITLTYNVKRGSGVYMVDKITESQMPDGLVLINPILCPVVRANYDVQRHVKSTNMVTYDDLMLEIETNGAISPKQALIEAITTLQDHFSSCLQKTSI